MQWTDMSTSIRKMTWTTISPPKNGSKHIKEVRNLKIERNGRPVHPRQPELEVIRTWHHKAKTRPTNLEWTNKGKTPSSETAVRGKENLQKLAQGRKGATKKQCFPLVSLRRVWETQKNLYKHSSLFQTQQNTESEAGSPQGKNKEEAEQCGLSDLDWKT